MGLRRWFRCTLCRYTGHRLVDLYVDSPVMSGYVSTVCVRCGSQIDEEYPTNN